MDRVENERTVRLSAVLADAGPKLIYTYDFGDSWEHSHPAFHLERYPLQLVVSVPTAQPLPALDHHQN